MPPVVLVSGDHDIRIIFCGEKYKEDDCSLKWIVEGGSVSLELFVVVVVLALGTIAVILRQGCNSKQNSDKMLHVALYD